MSEEQKECRICFEIGTYDDPLITPCKCKGTSAYIHKSCLSNWRNFNRGQEGWDTCMECRAKYIISRKYPTETLIYNIYFNLPGIYFFESFVALIGALLLWCIEYNTNYLAIKILNFNNPEKNKKIIKDVEESELIPQVFYYNFASCLISWIFHIKFYYNYRKKIKRKNDYWKQIRVVFLYNIIFNSNFIYLYYIFEWNFFETLFYNLSTFFSFLLPYTHYKLMKFHNEIIIDMNAENEEEVLSFTHNPLVNQDVELVNVIID
tara:strand:- start:6744 stop:7532 length:789 start_codon:yes stop_codon:yes gene_type:complete